MKKIVFLIILVILIPYIAVILFELLIGMHVIPFSSETPALLFLAFLITILPQIIYQILLYLISIVQKINFIIQLIGSVIISFMCSIFFTFSMYDGPKDMQEYLYRFYIVYLPALICSVSYFFMSTKIIKKNKNL